jgi:hypothetical protein
MLCMRRALEAEVGAAGARARLDAAFWSMANSLRSGDERQTRDSLTDDRTTEPALPVAGPPLDPGLPTRHAN